MTLKNFARVLAVPAGISLCSLLACSDPPKPPAQGVVQISVEPGAGSCSATHGTFSNPVETQQATVRNELLNCDPTSGQPCRPDTVIATDGADTDISCAVSGAADGYNISINFCNANSCINNGNHPFSFVANGTISPTGGQIYVGSTHQTDALSDDKCDITILHGSGGQLAGGTIWASFSCPNFISNGNPSSTQCAATGAFLFENCAH
jgi:hypothetical protein